MEAFRKRCGAMAYIIGAGSEVLVPAPSSAGGCVCSLHGPHVQLRVSDLPTLHKRFETWREAKAWFDKLPALLAPYSDDRMTFATQVIELFLPTPPQAAEDVMVEAELDRLKEQDRVALVVLHVGADKEVDPHSVN